ncbi:type IV pilus assembly protein PilM [Proteiniborus sp. DW1]|uniref:type IV pilus assembly protein PilM n=1 Tax=Proteiniborus sp. DW1 TaxID=1889883 RepID=UPI00092DF224|nr:type IV pilus assembly protein PilM [Proteiniborus sp. DW1]SCG83292.1 type IV pilus assembly protein PilM [Proteiniborus sp. DW1]
MILSLLNKNILSIDLGSYETKIIEAKKNNDFIQINKAFSLLTPKGSYEDGRIKNEKLLSEALRHEFKKNKISSKTAYLTIKSTAIITREVFFPLVELKEIRGMLMYQLPEYLPMDISRYAVQYKILGKFFDGEKERLNILVVAVPKDIVEKHYFLLSNLNLKPVVLDYQSNSISKLIWFTDTINNHILVSEKTIAAIDLGYSSTNVSIIKSGKIRISRAIEVGGEDLDRNIMNLFDFTKEELYEKKYNIRDVNEINTDYSDYNRFINVIKKTIESIIEKLEKIIKYYISKEVENDINMILLYGGLSQINGVDKLFSNYFNIDTVVFNNLDKVSIQTDPNKYFNCISTLLRDEEV